MANFNEGSSVKVKCKGCGKEFSVTRGRLKQKVYCSALCRTKSYNEKTFPGSEFPHGLATGTVATISEMRVCIDLLRRGLDVFRSQSSRKSSLVFIVERLCFRVAISTAYRSPVTSKLHFSEGPGEFDLLALALPDNEIVYLNRDHVEVIPETLTA